MPTPSKPDESALQEIDELMPAMPCAIHLANVRTYARRTEDPRRLRLLILAIADAWEAAISGRRPPPFAGGPLVAAEVGAKPSSESSGEPL